MTVQRDKRGKFLPGASPNPAGRPPGVGRVSALRGQISEAVPSILLALIEKAQAGDVQAARVLLERSIAPLRATEETTPLSLPVEASLADIARGILAAATAGGIAPGQAATLLAAAGGVAHIVEVTELSQRLDRIEKTLRANQGDDA